MPRAPLQVLVLPFRRTETGIEYAIFRRADGTMWQFVSGGAEDAETPLMAAQREAFEEAGIAGDLYWIALDSRASIRRTEFRGTEHWPSSIYVVPEMAFGVDASTCQIHLSHEHDDCCWCSSQTAQALLTWDSNRTALWELNERLKSAESNPEAMVRISKSPY